jgi:hypothetical protein
MWAYLALHQWILTLINRNNIKKIELTDDQVSEVCDEIEHQWLYLLMTRAVFPVDFEKLETWYSPDFYRNLGLNFKVCLPEGKSETFRKGAEGLAHWQNQNYVIRLYGILEKHGIMYSGRKAYKNKLLILLYELRPKIGAHSSGRSAANKAHLRKATELINELFNQNVDLNQVRNYDLSVDAVLQPMTKMAVQFVQNLRSSNIPEPPAPGAR